LDREAREQGEPTAPLTLRIERLYGLGRNLVRHGRVKHGAEAAASEALQLAQRIGATHDRQTQRPGAFQFGMIARDRGRHDDRPNPV